MKRRKRIYYTDTQKALMWDRWQQGESLHQIASLFDRHHSSVRNILAEHGSIRPPPRRRSARVLSLAEREEISRGLAAGRSIRAIAALLGRLPTVAEYLNYAADLQVDKDDTYRYMNFDQINSYVKKADEVIFKTAV